MNEDRSRGASAAAALTALIGWIGSMATWRQTSTAIIVVLAVVVAALAGASVYFLFVQNVRTALTIVGASATVPTLVVNVVLAVQALYERHYKARLTGEVQIEGKNTRGVTLTLSNSTGQNLPEQISDLTGRFEFFFRPPTNGAELYTLAAKHRSTGTYAKEISLRRGTSQEETIDLSHLDVIGDWSLDSAKTEAEILAQIRSEISATFSSDNTKEVARIVRAQYDLPDRLTVAPDGTLRVAGHQFGKWQAKADGPPDHYAISGPIDRVLRVMSMKGDNLALLRASANGGTSWCALYTRVSDSV